MDIDTSLMATRDPGSTHQLRGNVVEIYIPLFTGLSHYLMEEILHLGCMKPVNMWVLPLFTGFSTIPGGDNRISEPSTVSWKYLAFFERDSQVSGLHP